MSEEQNAAQKISDSPQQNQSNQTDNNNNKTDVSRETNNSSQSTQNDDTPSKNGYERVEFSPEQQARFDRLYGQVKAQDRKYAEALDIMRQQSDVISNLQNGMGQIANHIHAQDFNNQEETARDEADRSFQKGDSRGYLAAMEKVAKIQAQKIVSDTLRQQQPVQNQRPQPQQKANSGMDVVNRAAQQGLMPSHEIPVFETWQNERDESGNLMRPWAFRETSDPGSFESNLMVSASVFVNPKFVNRPIEEKLAEVDRIMGVKKSQPTQNVMGANLTGGRKTNNVQVSPDMERVLNHLRPRGPKAKDAPDQVDWYRKQVQRAKSLSQGGRR